jgi:hypothetical protein
VPQAPQVNLSVLNGDATSSDPSAIVADSAAARVALVAKYRSKMAAVSQNGGVARTKLAHLEDYLAAENGTYFLSGVYVSAPPQFRSVIDSTGNNKKDQTLCIVTITKDKVSIDITFFT